MLVSPYAGGAGRPVSSRDDRLHDDCGGLLTAREAADYLRVSGRTLWSMTQRGDVPCVRLGRSVRYDLADLRAAIDAAKSAPAQGGAP